METLTLADETVLEQSEVLLSDNTLFFYVRNGMSMAEVFGIMNNSEKTHRITAAQYGNEHVYEGYTDLQSIRKDNGQISGGLRKA